MTSSEILANVQKSKVPAFQKQVALFGNSRTIEYWSGTLSTKLLVGCRGAKGVGIALPDNIAE